MQNASPYKAEALHGFLNHYLNLVKMKNVILTAITALMLLSTSAWATVRTVSNLPSSPGEYTDLQIAMDSSQPGDTILVTGSPTNYGEVVVNIPLTILGDGYYYDGVTVSNTHTTVYTPKVRFEIRSSDVYISGFVAQFIMNARESNGQTIANVTVERCYLRYDVVSNVNYLVVFVGIINSDSNYAKIENVKFINNVFYSSSHSSYGVIFQSGSYSRLELNSLIFENNMFSSTIFRGLNYVINKETLIFSHNNFINLASNYSTFDNTMTDAVIKDNIFYQANPLGGTNCTYINNITFEVPILPGLVNLGVGNLNNTNPLFADYDNTPFKFTQDFSLFPSSPALGAASDGTDIGISGGAYPFEIGNTPRWSEVEEVILEESAIPINGILNVQFNAKGNN